MFQLKMLGCLRLDANGGQPVECPRRHLALLALLAVAGEKGFARERLAAHLWPDVPSENGRHSLEQLLSTLRGRLGQRAFEGTDPVRLNQQVIATDLGEFARKLREEDLEGAVNLYGGPLLDGFYLDGSKDFEEWSDRERARLATSYIDALERLAQGALSRGESTLAVRWWRQVVKADPLQAQGVLALMRALAAAGDRASAVQHARVYQKQIRDELELPPEPAVLQLAEELQAELAASPAKRDYTVPGAPARLTPGTVAEQAVKQPPDARKVTRGFLLRSAAVAAVILTVFFLFRSRTFSWTLLEPGWVLVADFEGPPDDPTLTRAVRELVTSALIESGRVATVPADQILEARRLAQVDDGDRLTVAVARHLAFRTAVGMVVDGSVTPIGGKGYSLVARLVDVNDGRVIASASGFADNRTIIAESRRLAQKLTTWVRPLATDGSHAAPRPRVITSSFEAYRSYAEGMEQYQNGDMVGAGRSFHKALELDSEFAQAWFHLGLATGWIDATDSSYSAFRQAALHLDRLSLADRLMLDVQLKTRTTDRILALERLIQTTPVALEEYFQLGRNLQQLGRYDEAMAAAEIADSNWPLGTPARIVIERALLLAALGHNESANRVGAGLTGYFRDGLVKFTLMSSGDWERAESLSVARMADVSLPPARRFRQKLIIASALAARGRLNDADHLLAEAEAMAIQAGISRGGGGDHSRLGPQRLLQSLVSGRAPHTPPRTVGDTSLDVMILNGIWASFTGNLVQATQLLDSARGKGLDDGYGFWRDLLGFEASLAAVRQDWPGVTRLLTHAAYEGGGQIEGGLVFRRWLVADAYEQMGQLDSAAAFFEMIVTPVRTSWWEIFAKGPASPFAHRRLARIYAKTGQHELARRHWASFLAMFTQPDSDLEWMVSEAKAELRKMSD